MAKLLTVLKQRLKFWLPISGASTAFDKQRSAYGRVPAVQKIQCIKRCVHVFVKNESRKELLLLLFLALPLAV